MKALIAALLCLTFISDSRPQLLVLGDSSAVGAAPLIADALGADATYTPTPDLAAAERAWSERSRTPDYVALIVGFDEVVGATAPISETLWHDHYEALIDAMYRSMADPSRVIVVTPRRVPDYYAQAVQLARIRDSIRSAAAGHNTQLADWWLLGVSAEQSSLAQSVVATQRPFAIYLPMSSGPCHASF